MRWTARDAPRAVFAVAMAGLAAERAFGARDAAPKA
jgi:hypothetical protein